MFRTFKTALPLLALAVALLAAPPAAATDDAAAVMHMAGTLLNGYAEVPAVVSDGVGKFALRGEDHGEEFRWALGYANTEGRVMQAHIHVGQRGANGGVAVFLCTNMDNGPIGIQPCPEGPATVTGTLTARDVIGGAADQGVEEGDLDALMKAIRAGAAYINVHSERFPGGELRGQVRPPRRFAPATIRPRP